MKDSILFGGEVGEGGAEITKVLFPTRVWKKEEEEEEEEEEAIFLGFSGCFGGLPPLGGHFKQLIEYVAGGGEPETREWERKTGKEGGKKIQCSLLLLFPPSFPSPQGKTSWNGSGFSFQCGICLQSNEYHFRHFLQ